MIIAFSLLLVQVQTVDQFIVNGFNISCFCMLFHHCDYLVVFKEVDFLKELLSVSFGPKLTTYAKHNKRMVKNNISS